MCAQVGNQWSCGVVTARVRTDAVRSLRHQRRDLRQSTYLIPLKRSGLILLSYNLWNRFKLESSLNFKGVQTLWKKSCKFNKILSWLDLHNCEFSCAHLYARNGSSYTSANMTLFERKKKSLSLKFKLHNTYNTNKTYDYMMRYCLNTVVAIVTPGA
jgi:hypothetical protein